MARTGSLGGLVENERLNAALAWVLAGFVIAVVIANLVEGRLLWAAVAALVAALVLVPPVAYRDPAAMLPWEVVLLAVLPLLGRTFATVALTSRLAAYLSVAALALIVAVELHVFTAVRMTHAFAILFVVVATMAAAGVLAVMQYLSDISLGTTFIRSEQRLMWDFVYATAAGIGAGVVFDLYFRRFVSGEGRLPDEGEEAAR